jgi:hypothetical protein
MLTEYSMWKFDSSNLHLGFPLGHSYAVHWEIAVSLHMHAVNLASRERNKNTSSYRAAQKSIPNFYRLSNGKFVIREFCTAWLKCLLRGDPAGGSM